MISPPCFTFTPPHQVHAEIWSCDACPAAAILKSGPQTVAVTNVRSVTFSPPHIIIQTLVSGFQEKPLITLLKRCLGKSEAENLPPPAPAIISGEKKSVNLMFIQPDFNHAPQMEEDDM